MVMNLRDWLIILGILVVLGILVDGLRRIWASRRRANELHFGLEKNQGLSRVQEELPHGGSRISRDVSMPKGRIVTPATTSVRREPVVPEAPLLEPGLGSVVSPARILSQEQADMYADRRKGSASGAEKAADVTHDERVFIGEDDPVFSMDMDDIHLLPEDEPSLYQDSFDEEPEPVEERDDSAVQEEFLVINVEAAKGKPYSGERLQAFFAKEHLYFGAMSIFHRHAEEDGSGRVLFSTVNGVKPGIFDPATMADMSTPVLSFFMGLPGPGNPHQAFHIMVECVYNLTKELGGTLKDDQHSGLTVQTLEHYRERICDFERRHLSARRKTTERV